LPVVDDQDETSACAFRIPDLSDKRAVAAFYKHDLGRKRVLSKLKFIRIDHIFFAAGSDVHFAAAVHALFVEIDLAYLNWLVSSMLTKL
jgi:hypothetical protein